MFNVEPIINLIRDHGYKKEEAYVTDGCEYYKNKHDYRVNINFHVLTLLPTSFSIRCEEQSTVMGDMDPDTFKINNKYFLYSDEQFFKFKYDPPTIRIRKESKYERTIEYTYTYTKSGGGLIQYEDSEGNYWDHTMGCPNLFGDVGDMVDRYLKLTENPLRNRLDMKPFRLRLPQDAVAPKKGRYVEP